MCLLVLAWKVHPRYRLVIAANRDEFHERPALPLAPWPEPDLILGGRDLQAGGTWLAVDHKRRVGVVTNFRDLQRPAPGAPSRGDLIPGFLRQDAPPGEYLSALEANAARYSGFNLLLADDQELWYASNRATPFARPLLPGVYGLSNWFLDTPWPKLERVRRRFKLWLNAPGGGAVDELFTLLHDREPATPEENPPRTGLSPEWERIVSAPFIVHPEYGTRCSTVVLLEPSGAMLIREQRFDPAGHPAGETEFRLNAGQWLHTVRNRRPPGQL